MLANLFDQLFEFDGSALLGADKGIDTLFQLGEFILFRLDAETIDAGLDVSNPLVGGKPLPLEWRFFLGQTECLQGTEIGTVAVRQEGVDVNQHFKFPNHLNVNAGVVLGIVSERAVRYPRGTFGTSDLFLLFLNLLEKFEDHLVCFVFAHMFGC